jgi:site-specific DNA-cytosine methylase
MVETLSARNYVRIGDAAAMLGVTEQTLRNWDRQGRLRAFRHPVNGYRLYGVAELGTLLRDVRQLRDSTEWQPDLDLHVVPSDVADFEPCHWSLDVALDPKHRPQQWSSPSTTVRRDWRKYPQEAHVLSADGRLYRRLTTDEIALLQGFDPDLFRSLKLTDREKIATIGDAVPPPLAAAVVGALREVVDLSIQTSLEICAGAGGLAAGSSAGGLEHLALVDYSPTAGQVLSHGRPWPSERVHVADVRSFDFSPWRDRVGLLSGGPPCQPWSQSGLRQGADDERDLLGWIDQLVASLQPQAFIFENVPGLLADANKGYVSSLVTRLRNASGERSYGVLVAKLNAADFGLPQTRERIFFVGLRRRTTSQTAKWLDAVYARRTHAPMADQVRGLAKWRTVGDVLADRNDPGGWRRWITR